MWPVMSNLSVWRSVWWMSRLVTSFKNTLKHPEMAPLSGSVNGFTCWLMSVVQFLNFLTIYKTNQWNFICIAQSHNSQIISLGLTNRTDVISYCDSCNSFSLQSERLIVTWSCNFILSLVGLTCQVHYFANLTLNTQLVFVLNFQSMIDSG